MNIIQFFGINFVIFLTGKIKKRLDKYRITPFANIRYPHFPHSFAYNFVYSICT